ncbi:MAG: exodeoxyribonuclease VII small subunit [Acidimicrobiales bacterium]|nr:exodeoxyribonuclease VII small subunit [Acidimicrobiales bacterium]
MPPGVTGYADAVRELEAILAELEHDDIDIDQLAAQVRRAAVLIRFCRSRILEARVEVEQVVADLDAAIVDDGEDLPDEE